MITLHISSAQSISVIEDDSSYRYRSLMAKPQLYLKFSSSEFQEIPVGSWCEYQGQRFTLQSPENIKKNGTRNIEFTLIMGTDEDNLGKYKMRNSVDNRLKYSMCATPKEFIQEIVSNLNKRDGDGVWKVGRCIESTEKTIEFNHSFCDAALSSICDTFETEYEIVDYTINLGKVEYFKEDPLPLSYGRGNGFMPGVGRTTELSEKPIEILYVQGGSQNIDKSVYGSAELLLPKSKELVYEGKTYVSSADGMSIQQKDKELRYHNEDSLDCEEIYPKRIGKVSKLVTVNAEKNFYDIVDLTIPNEINYNDYLIEGESMTIIFQSGMLAGREFEVKYKHSERRFELVPQEFDGVTMPNATFAPKADESGINCDTYAVFGCTLPQGYICNDSTQEGASWDMFREAAKHLYENEEQKFTFTGVLQGLWSKRNWVNVGGRLKVGSYILFSDEQFAKYGINIRITGIKDFLNSPYSPTIELSNSVSGESIVTSLRKIENTEITIDEKHKDSIQFTKRRFRDAQETMDMLNDALLHYSDSINPVAVQTMALLVGDESLQFRFIDGRETLNVIDYHINYDKETKKLSCAHTFIQHLTLGISTISSTHINSEYKVWELSEFESAYLDDASKKFYFYAKVKRNDTSAKGEFVLSETAKDMTCEADYYYLLVGILNSELEEERSFASLYGFTEILPARITTDKIVSADGKSFIELANNAFRIGNDDEYIDWNNEEESTLIMNNAKIKNALKVIGEATLAGFIFTDDIIKSVRKSGNNPSFYLDGKNGKIHLSSQYTGGSFSIDDEKSDLDLDAYTGVIQARNNNGAAYLSASGIFCNNPMTNALPSSMGYTHYGAMVGLGYTSKPVNYDWVMDSESTIIAGVYGRASNSGNAAAYGGYFQNLLASGLILKQKYITDSAATSAVSLSSGYTQVVGLTNSGKRGTVYLPTDGYEGRVIYAKQISSGTMRFYPTGGQKIFDDDSENEYYDVSCGQELKFTFSKYVYGGVSVEVWLVSRWSF